MSQNLATRRGISMSETVISTMLIGFVLVSTLQIVGPIVQSTSVHADRLVAANLANELSEEIATKLFTNPGTPSGDSIGVDDSERAAFRSDFNDVDDYHGWSSSPPKLSTDQFHINLSDWTRSVKVAHVLVNDPTTTSGTYTGLKRVSVVVSKNGVSHATVFSLHSESADSLGYILPITDVVVVGGGG